MVQPPEVLFDRECGDSSLLSSPRAIHSQGGCCAGSKQKSPEVRTRSFKMVLASIMKKMGDAQASKGTGSVSSMFAKTPAQKDPSPAVEKPEVEAAAQDEVAGTDRARSPSEVRAELLVRVKFFRADAMHANPRYRLCSSTNCGVGMEQGSEPAGSAEAPSPQEEEDVPSRAGEDAAMRDAGPNEGGVPAEEAGSAPDSPVQTLRRVRRVEADDADEEEEKEEVVETALVVAGDASRYRQEVAVAGDQGLLLLPSAPGSCIFPSSVCARTNVPCESTSEAWCSVCDAAPWAAI